MIDDGGHHGNVDHRIIVLVVRRVRGGDGRDGFSRRQFFGLHDDGDRAGGVGQVHEFVRLVRRLIQIAQDVVGGDAGSLEGLNQAIAAVHEVFQLFTRHLASLGHIGQHPLAIGPGLVHHVATLLLGHQDLGFGVRRGILATAGGLEVGVFANARGFVGGLADEPGGRLVGANLDLGCGLSGGLDDPGGLLAQHLGHGVLVQFQGSNRGPMLGICQFPLEEQHAFLKPGQLSGHHPQEVADLVLVEATACGRESRAGNGGRRRRVGTRKRDSH